MRKITFLLTLIILSLASSVILYVIYDYPVESDAYQNKVIAENLLRHKTYSWSKEAPYIPTAIREPAYPAFLAILLWLFRESYTAVYLSQIVIFVLTVILVYFLSSKILGETIARYTALLTALCPTLANYPSFLLSETLFTFLLVLFMAVILKTVQTNRTGWYMTSGILLAVTTLTKSVTIFLFIAIVFSGLLYSGGIRPFFKKYLRNFMLLSLVFLVLISPWVVRNYAKFGKLSMTMRGSRALWVRGEKLDYNFEDTKKQLVFIFSEYLGARLYPQEAQPHLYLVKEAWRCYEKEQKLESLGHNEAEIDHILLREAWDRIKKRPFKYLSQNFLELFKMAAFMYVPLLNQARIMERFDSINNGPLLLSLVRGGFRLLAYPVLLFAGFGFFAERKKWRQWIFVAFLILYINLSLSCLFGWGRYSVPLIPYYLMFAVAGFIFIKQKLFGKGRPLCVKRY